MQELGINYSISVPPAIMASVTSLDKDMRKLRMDRYTPQAAKEVRDWIEEALGERLANGDLMEALKDGVALCRCVYHGKVWADVNINVVKTCEHGTATTRHQVQAISDAFRANGEYIALPSSMPISST